MYWQADESMRKLEPLSAAIVYMLSSTEPITPPAVLVTEIVAGGKAQVDVLFIVRLNFTGITPRLALKMLLPSALIGGCTNAL